MSVESTGAKLRTRTLHLAENQDIPDDLMVPAGHDVLPRHRVERNGRGAFQANRFCRTFRPVDRRHLRRAGMGLRLVIGKGAANTIDDGLSS
jgi:hypothetical protein